MEGKAKPGFPSLFSDTLDKAVDKKIKGSNGRCDPTVRALWKPDAIARIRSYAKVIVSLSCRKGKAHICDVS